MADSGNDRTQNGNDILFNATLEAAMIMLKRELDDGATLEEMREIVAGLLYFAQGKRTQ